MGGGRMGGWRDDGWMEGGWRVCVINPLILPGLRGAPGYSLEQAHHLPIEMDPLIGERTPLHQSGTSR